MSRSFNWFYVLVVVLFVAMLYINFRYFRGSSSLVIGITQAKDYKINTEKPSLVKAVHVVPGKQVKQGDLLIELTSDALEIDIAKLTNHIAALTSEETDKMKLKDSEVAYIRAQHAIAEEELNADISKIEIEQKLNSRLSKELNGNFSETTSMEDNPAHQKINSLGKQKAARNQALNIKIKDLEQETATDLNLLHNQIALLTHELTLMSEEKKKLSKYAMADGVVENVYVKEGEQVEAFTALLAIDPLTPTTVVGYISGRRMPIQMGDTVSVSSYDKRSGACSGVVIGFGAVSTLPEILQKSTAVKAFGQEVFIAITPTNAFAIGEKVLIK